MIWQSWVLSGLGLAALVVACAAILAVWSERDYRKTRPGPAPAQPSRAGEGLDGSGQEATASRNEGVPTLLSTGDLGSP